MFIFWYICQNIWSSKVFTLYQFLMADPVCWVNFYILVAIAIMKDCSSVLKSGLMSILKNVLMIVLMIILKSLLTSLLKSLFG